MPVVAMPAKKRPSKRWSRLYTACQQNAGSSCRLPAGTLVAVGARDLRLAESLVRFPSIRCFSGDLISQAMRGAEHFVHGFHRRHAGLIFGMPLCLTRAPTFSRSI